MTESDRETVVAWLHLNDEEEIGDFHLGEVWKTVALEPAGNPGFRKTTALLEREARALLAQPNEQLIESLYQKLGVTSRESCLGLPKGPYYHSVDVPAIRQGLTRALEIAGESYRFRQRMGQEAQQANDR